jgi:hypothetical protein
VPVRQQWKLEDVKARWQRRSLVETPTAVDAEDPIGDERGVVTVEQGHTRCCWGACLQAVPNLIRPGNTLNLH